MTEVPEHLLKRSRDRRAAGGGGSESASPAASDAPASSEVAPVGATAAAAPAAASPGVPEPPAPLAPYVEAALTRRKIPIWVMPVIAFLPLWAIIYLGGLSPASTGEPTQLELGQEIYAAQCAGCHGAAGGGGAGRAFTNGDLAKTFPDIIGQLEFVWLGSNGTGPGGTVYGDPNREGGAHATLSYNGNPMPAFGEVLNQAELLAVVRYEWEVLGGGVVEAAQVDADGNLIYANGMPMLSDDGELLTPDGQPLFDAEGKLTIAPNWTSPTGSM